MKKIFRTLCVAALALVGMTANAQNNTISIEDFTVEAGKTVVVPVNLTNTVGVRNLQFDLILPADLEVTKVNMTSRVPSDEDGYLLSKSFNKVVENGIAKTRVLLVDGAATGASVAAGEGAVLKVTFQAADDILGDTPITVSGIVISTDNGDEYPESFTVKYAAAATGINNVSFDQNAELYNLQGVKVNNAQKGVYIQNGKKYMVK